MISVPEALNILKENLPEPRVVYVTIEEAYSRRLARDILAPEPSPRYTNSAMDGFAVQGKDVCSIEEGGAVSLQIIGESQAGVPFQGVVSEGEAIRISTGAVVPDGADTIIRVEDTEDRDETVLIKRCKSIGQDVRRAGEEFQEGATILEKGLILKARQIALLSSIGQSRVPVYDKPTVSLLITGTELARHDDREIKPYQVRDANSPMLHSAVIEAGGSLLDFIHVEDSLQATIEQMANVLAKKGDIILCSGGVSVGRHDHVKEAAKEVGFRELFWKIRQKPGKPLFVAKHNQTLLFGLPGNPVSAFMCFQNFVMPTLAALQGVDLLKETISAAALEDIHNPGKRTDFLRVNITREPNATPTFKLIDRQGSHMLTSIVEADGYIALEPGFSLKAGDITDVFVF